MLQYIYIYIYVVSAVNIMNSITEYYKMQILHENRKYFTIDIVYFELSNLYFKFKLNYIIIKTIYYIELNHFLINSYSLIMRIIYYFFFFIEVLVS